MGLEEPSKRAASPAGLLSGGGIQGVRWGLNMFVKFKFAYLRVCFVVITHISRFSIIQCAFGSS